MSRSGSLRSQLALFLNQLQSATTKAESVLASDPASSDPSAVAAHVRTLNEASRKLTITLKRFYACHQEWVDLTKSITDPDELEQEQLLYDKVCTSFHTATLYAEETQAEVDAKASSLTPAPPRIVAPAPTPPSSTSTSGATRLQTPLKPPKLELPTFAGDYLQWKQFWGLFEANVHARTDLTNIEKFTFLLQHLRDTARETLDGLTIDDPTYDDAVALLKARFDRANDRIISRLYCDFDKIPTADKTTANKQKTLDSCEKIFRQLQSAGEAVNSNRSLTIQMLKKFPSDMIHDLQRFHRLGPNSALDDIRKGINEFIAESEATESIIEDLHPPRKDKSAKPEATEAKAIDTIPPQVYSNSALVAVSPPNTFTAKRPQMLTPPSNCYFCGSNHFNSSCRNYPTAKARQSRLTEVDRCTRCMKHHARSKGQPCPVDIRCVHCGTNGSHTTALCYSSFPDTAATGPVVPQPISTASEQTLHTHTAPELKDTSSGGLTALNCATKRPSLFQTAKTMVVNPATGDHYIMRLALDTLSSRSYITEAAAGKLNLLGPNHENLFVSVFGTNRTLEMPTREVSFLITLQDGSTLEICANTTNIISRSSALPSGWSAREQSALSQHANMLADDPFDTNGMMDILIGSNLVWELVQGVRIPTSSPHLFLIPTRLGHMLSGDSEYEGYNPSRSTLLCLTEGPCQFPSALGLVSCATKAQPTYPDIDEFWNLEKIGIADSPVDTEADEELEVFRNSVSYVNGRYEIKWPVIPSKIALLPTNYELAYNRFRSLTKRLKTNPKILQGYRDVLNTQIERGIIEKVPDNELTTDKRQHYLPHHPVLKDSSATTKIRIVYDAGSKTDKKSVSLNDCLMRGPVILPDLCHVLMRMRVYETVVIADIEKAFLNISLHPDDRDTTRFLWFKDDNHLSLADNVAVYRFCRILFGAKPCPSLLGFTLDLHLSNENTPLALQLKDDMFVDNAFHGFNGLDVSIDVYHEMKAIFQRAGMNIQEFCSNSNKLMQFLPSHDAVKNPDTKFLGLKWDSQDSDTLRLPSNARIQQPCETTTKRTILQAVASVFDPLGWFQPALLPAKLLLQRLWDLSYNWDDIVSHDLQCEWDDLRQSLSGLSEHRVPRFIGRVDTEFTLAVFCDASGKAYATSVYLRCFQPDGLWQPNLLFAKSRLSPQVHLRKGESTPITLPRLELLGVVIGTRAATFCREALKSPAAKVDLFCDSEVVHHWIRSRGMLKRFVRSRIDEIRSIKNTEFHFVDTADNPADYSTRGKTAEELRTSETWWHGPTWLRRDAETWPKRNIEPIEGESLRNMEAEIKPVYVSHTLAATAPPECSATSTVLTTMALGQHRPQKREPALTTLITINPNDVSTLAKLLRISVYCLKFMKRVVWNRLSDETRHAHQQLTSLFEPVTTDTEITGTEIGHLKKQWTRSVQCDAFPELFADEPITSLAMKQLVAQLNLKIDHEGIIRTHGRLQNADLEERTRAPMLLPKSSRLTTLVIHDTHAMLMHSGVSHTLSSVRNEYWILHGRASVRAALRACRTCKVFKNGKPFRLPPMPALPRSRVETAIPFEFTGLDYFGPVVVKTNGVPTKMWACLFTCMVIRAVHLEPVTDCSTVEFLNCLIRFFSRRGVPKTITCDNAGQFHLTKILGDRAWKRTPTDPTVTNYTAHHEVTWKFITELAPWQGGFYERLVGLVKSTLRSSIKRKMLTWSDFITLLTEAEAVINSRPITYVGDDPDSQTRVLRPSDFLLSAPASTQSEDEKKVMAKDFGDAGKLLLAAWKKRSKTLDTLWEFWRDEYLLSLRERPILNHTCGRSDVDRVPKVNQVVLIVDSDLPRGRWRYARVTSLIRSQDGVVRSAEVVLGNRARIRRPINLLVPLEVESISELAKQGDGDHPLNFSSGLGEPDSPDTEFAGFTKNDIKRAAEALTRFDSEPQRTEVAQVDFGCDDQ